MSSGIKDAVFGNVTALEKYNIPVAEIIEGRKKIANEGPGKLVFPNKPDCLSAVGLTNESLCLLPPLCHHSATPSSHLQTASFTLNPPPTLLVVVLPSSHLGSLPAPQPQSKYSFLSDFLQSQMCQGCSHYWVSRELWATWIKEFACFTSLLLSIVGILYLLLLAQKQHKVSVEGKNVWNE